MNKIEELKSVIGETTSQNQSPTLRAQLVLVDNTHCTFKVVAPLYNSNGGISEVGKLYKVPTTYAWNSFFF
jgi:hypothetical protein